MTAALRVGATLEPTPLELARDTLLKEALSEANEMPDATLQFKAAARAYRALLEPAP